MNLSVLIENFLKKLETDGHTSKLTVKNYTHYLHRFLEFSKEIDPEQINLELVSKYKFHLSHYIDLKTKKPLKKITQNYFIIALRAFLRYLHEVGVSSLLSEKVELEGADPKVKLKVLDDNDIKQLLAAPKTDKKDGIRDRAILETLFSTGLRVSELASLNREDINIEVKEFNFKGQKNKSRFVSISDSAADCLRKYLHLRLDNFKPLFIRFQGKVESENDGEKMRLTTRSIERIVEKYVKELGLSIKATPQTLRHSFAIESLIHGADIQTVQEMLGHNSLSTTQVYKSVTNN